MADTDLQTDPDAPPRRFLGVGIGVYDQADLDDLRAPEDAQALADLLEERGYTTTVLRDIGLDDAASRIKAALPNDSATGGAAVVYWAGHGDLATSSDLSLLTRSSEPGDEAHWTIRQLFGRAARSGATQILVVVDTCYAGAALRRAAEEVRGFLDSRDGWDGWVGVLVSTGAGTPARDERFVEELVRVLRCGPRDPVLGLRFHAYNRGVRGDDVIEVLRREWPDGLGQSPDGIGIGLAEVMFLNPRYTPDAPEEIVEHLLLAAEGRAVDEEGTYFTGRVAPLTRIVDWFATATCGVLAVTGSAGSGKSAVAGRLLALSHETEGAAIRERGTPVGPDPGTGSIDAHVHARRLTADGVAEVLSLQLVHRRILGGPDRMNRNELAGALQRRSETGSRGRPLRLVIDGIDEAETEAWTVADELVRRIAPYAQVLVTTRQVAGHRRGLLEVLDPDEVVDLNAPDLREATRADVRAYVRARLGDQPELDAALVADRILGSGDLDEGPFLLARLVTTQLRSMEIDTSDPGWTETVATSVEDAFDRDIDRVTSVAPNGEAGATAGRALLAALAWGYGAGLPAEEWATVAGALTGRPYGSDDAYWALGQLGRYVVAADGGGVAAYRLSHQRLAHHLHPPRPDDIPFGGGDAVRVARALTDRLRRVLAAGGTTDGSPYLQAHLWRHVADAGAPGVQVVRDGLPPQPARRVTLARALHEVAQRSAPTDPAGAREAVDEAIALLQAAVEAELGFRYDLATALRTRARLREEGEADAARIDREGSLALLRAIHTETTEGRAALATITRPGAWAAEWVAQGAPTKARPVVTVREVAVVDEGLASSGAEVSSEMASLLVELSSTYEASGRQDDAIAHAEEAVAVLQALTEDDPRHKAGLAAALVRLGVCLRGAP